MKVVSKMKTSILLILMVGTFTTALPKKGNLVKANGVTKADGIDDGSKLMDAAPTPHRKFNLCFLNLSSLF